MEPATDTDAPAMRESAAPELQEAEFEAFKVSRVMSLRKDIWQLIAPWRHCGKKPPFTVGEMAVFAMIHSNEHDDSDRDVHVLSVAEIHASILLTFSYYGKLAINAFAYFSALQRLQKRVILEEVVEGFPENLRDFDLPLTITAVRWPTYRTPSEYGITANAARVYLRRWLEPARAGKFRFLDLSPELRNKIYEKVLRFPDVGINFSEDKHFQLIPGDQKYDHTVDPYSEVNREQFVSNQVCSELLALFRTCKKIHQESSSVFYGVNNFRFDTLKDLHIALSAMPIRAQEQIQCLHICLGADATTFYDMAPVGNMLHHLAPKRLKFSFFHCHWFEQYNQVRRSVYNRTGKVSGKKPVQVDTCEMVEELKPFMDLARRAEKIEIFDWGGTAFREFVMGQLGLQQTCSAAVKQGNWVHCVVKG
ncbi:hypothetical protein CB0940_11436 [Cercospora beticola]|uniref:DUF7730 domain-containing protein n=1 Tax=Cercospora beticola TaxID=122368 RepID=A0A2G5HE87_CERBT|nr:hypothetical protein CB0940_11436 [Cercospora beticola]PIA90839.1 hypothetical protein CB0940_11436 [Cercospora beticola]WPB08290.1 hypothetical protein RHO25_012956 [Cercospora beticola]CAK1367829.1 unnamed protein product [Cercospora beticola]